jgi:GT2 family glycosyltransferase
MTRPVHAVVVAYYAAETLDTCLASLQHDATVIVVDNSNSPTVRDVAYRRGADYVDPGKNLGFASGVNLALRRLEERPPGDVVLVNPDAVLTSENLHVLADFLHRPGNERIAAVSPRLVGIDGGEQRVAWPFPTPGRAWAEAVGFDLPAARTFVIGAVLMLKWEAIHEVGPFDERFFLYAEEADWQRRALALGWSSRLCPTAVATHVGAGTSEDARRREILFHAAHETYIRKWHGRWGWFSYRSAAFLGASVRALVLIRGRRAEAARRALLYLRGPRRCAAMAHE